MSMSKYDSSGFSGQSYDRNVFEANLSTVNKWQRDFWTAKQVLRKKMGKEDDRHVVQSDNDLDSKLNLFNSVQDTCAALLKTVENYQKCICVLSRDENSMGRFLKDQGVLDKTPAGKMMGAVGKAQCYTSQQRLLLRNSLSRMNHDVETFRYRAVGDSVLSVDQMEDARTHYRASLRWMQDISANLDPEQYKKLEKFRKVQTEVRLNKDKFDKLKWAVCQKVDLLCASRSNLFSNILVPYQNEVLKFWEKTAHTMAAVLENIKDYQTYEFKLLKDLNPMQDIDEGKDGVNKEKGEGKESGGKDVDEKENETQLISLSDQELTDQNLVGDAINKLKLYSSNEDNEADENKSEKKLIDVDLLLNDFGSTDFHEPSKEDLNLLNDILGDVDQPATGDLEEQWNSVFGEFTQAMQTPPNPPLPDDLESQDEQKEEGGGYLPSQLMDMMLMSDSTSQNTLNGQQQIGQMGLYQNNGPPGIVGGYQPPSYNSMFGGHVPFGNFQKAGPSNMAPNAATNGNQITSPPKKDLNDHKSAWFNLFAELDPLQNPDNLLKKKGEGSKLLKQDTGGAC